jgi:hypothetical protein
VLAEARGRPGERLQQPVGTRVQPCLGERGHPDI